MIARDFAAALLDPDLPVPAGLTGPQAQPAGRRFGVYRNNVAVSLTRALEDGFPVLRALLGAEFFAAMAGVFLRRHPPDSALLMHYGQDMPAFLAAFPPVAHLPYLPDVARLELALRRAYHATDAAPVPAQRLMALAPDRLAAARLRLAPAVAVIRSAHPLHAIWLAAQAPAERRRFSGAEDVAVLRPGFDPVVRLLPPGGAAFLLALQGGDAIAAAVSAGGADLDLAATLALLVEGQAITELEETD
jgi:hypothetical protein